MTIDFERNQALLDKDFQLFYGFGDKDVGLTPLAVQADRGRGRLLHVAGLAAGRDAEEKRVPRDLVLVLDTSGSMSRHQDGAGEEGPQVLPRATRAPTTASPSSTSPPRVDAVPRQARAARTRTTSTHAKKWVDGLKATGGTAI